MGQIRPSRFFRQGDLWWQFRSLQELGRKDEAGELLLEHREEIINGNKPYLKDLVICL